MDNFDPEKRLDCRVSVRMDLDVDRIIFNDRVLNLPKPLQIKVDNISCSGLLMTTCLDLPKNTCFCLKIDLKNSTIDVVMEIVRKEYNGKRFLYGCRILSLAPSEQQILRQFIFDEQVKLRKRLRRD